MDDAHQFLATIRDWRAHATSPVDMCRRIWNQLSYNYLYNCRDFVLRYAHESESGLALHSHSWGCVVIDHGRTITVSAVCTSASKMQSSAGRGYSKAFNLDPIEMHAHA